ncbi:MAG: RecQ family zinc-binding domain-containing protein [Proteobacteria bacterium]|nr:RecQ family zinc-binding domain-containing protein [Pseudomonadota bacterium]
MKIQEHFIDSAQPSPKHFDHILKVIESASEPLKITSIKQLSGMHPTLVTVAITELVEQGFIKKISERGSQVYIRTEKTGSPNLQRYETQFVVRTQELSSMEHYAEQKEKCLMQILRNALGDSTQEKCNQCHVCNRQEFSEAIDKEQVMLINNWLSNKGCPIKASKIVKIEEGISMLDGKLRIPDFIYFMKQRAVTQSLGVSDDLKAMIEKHIRILCKKNQFGSVIVLPSRTWKARSLMARKIAEQLKVPVVDCLSWKTEPKARQGELLNNDQRRENVVNKMQCQLINQIPTGAILLLDDYTGSFATLQEAGRALRKEGKITQKIIPFTIASVKWRLGKRGMI